MLFVSFAFISCKKSDFRHQSDFDKSYNKWVKFKETSGDSYRYTVSGRSLTGLGWQTVITVSEGKIVHRDFKYILPVRGWDGNIPAAEMEWTENENEINPRTPDLTGI